MYDFLMNWMPLISPFIFENILREMILLRIQNQVDEWDPQTDQIPIHVWIHPWINFLGVYNFYMTYFIELLTVKLWIHERCATIQH